MDTVELLFMRQRHISTPILRTAMWSPWSHEAAIMPGEQTVIDATFFHGVSERSLPALLAVASKFERIKYEVPNADAGYEWLRTQVGKPYDTWGVVGIGAHQDWEQDDSWFCSELAEAFLAKCGKPRFRTKIGRVTPLHSYMVL